MRFHFVEIGTCDYDTLLESCGDDQIGISVEPIKEYLDRLPDRPNVTKINAAISSTDGLVDLYWVRPEHQDKPGLSCTKGWGSITKPHPGHARDAERLIGTGILTKEPVQAITWSTLVDLCGITGVDFVKIDTEGHDCVVVDSILDAGLEWYPHKIQFEITHIPPEARLRTEQRLQEHGYRQISAGEDAVFERREA